MHESYDVDLAVVGSGAAGLTAAIVAADAGLRVLVIERASKLGGVTAVSGGGVWAPLTRWGLAANPADSPDQVLSYLEFVAAGYGSAAHRRRFVEAAPLAVHYLADRAGVRWSLQYGHVDNFDPIAPGSVRDCRFLEVQPFLGAALAQWQDRTLRSPFYRSGLTASESLRPERAAAPLSELIAHRRAQDARTCGDGLMAYLVKAAMLDRKIPALLDTRADSLLVDDGAVTGLRAVAPGGTEILVRARRGVLLATGGYDHNTVDMPEGIPAFHSSCPPTVTGDHLTMAGEIGAMITTLPPIGLHTQFGYRIPGEEFEGAPLWRWCMFEPGSKHAIIVNSRAERFCDESWFYHQQNLLRQFDSWERRYVNLPAFLIFDQSHRDETMFGPYRPGVELPKDPFLRSDTLDGLSEQLGLDPASLQTTVNKFNGFCSRGVDNDFSRGSRGFMQYLRPGEPGDNTSLGPLERAPFYGLKLGIGGLGANQTGLHTDHNAVVQHLRGRPIKGLYAAGNATAHLDFGPAYISGGLIARGIAWGYVAAKHAADRACIA